MERLTVQVAIDLLKRAVDEKGRDYVYVDQHDRLAGQGSTHCVNVVKVGGALVPSCIVGDTLVRHGVAPRWFAFTNTIGAPAYEVIRTLRAREWLDVDDDAVTLLSFAQRLQDNGETWGEAYDRTFLLYQVLMDTRYAKTQ